MVLPVDKPIKTAVVGCGNWGQLLIHTIHQNENYHLRYFCDTDRHKLDRLKSRFGYVIPLTAPDQILQDVEVDLVVIAVPLAEHFNMVKKCLEAGKHVFVEQPMARSGAECEELIRLASEAERILMVGHIDRFNPALSRVKRYLDEGKLGKIHYIYGQRLNFGGHVFQSNCLWELLSHDLYIMQELLGFAPSCFTVKGLSSINSNHTDVIFATFKIGENKMANFIAGWMHPMKIRRLSIVGSEMMLAFDDVEPSNKITLFDKKVTVAGDQERKNGVQSFGEFQTRIQTGDILIPKIDLDEPLKLEFQHLVDCLSGRCRPLTDGAAGLRVVRLLEQIQQSMDNSGWETIH